MNDEWRAQVVQDGMVVASAHGPDRETVEAQGRHYLLMYRSDGPATMSVAQRQDGRWKRVESGR